MSAGRRKVAPGSPGDWLRHAMSDLALGRLGRGRPDVLPAQVCFHAQQAIEKALKGFLTHHHLRFPPVHDLEQLLEILQRSDIGLPDWSEELLKATPYAVETRYPGGWEEVTHEDCNRALELAAKTVDWVTSEIQSPPPECNLH